MEKNVEEEKNSFMATTLNCGMKLVLNQTRSFRLNVSLEYFTFCSASEINSFLLSVLDLSGRESKHLLKDSSSLSTSFLSFGTTHPSLLILDVNERDAFRLSSKESMEYRRAFSTMLFTWAFQKSLSIILFGPEAGITNVSATSFRKATSSFDSMESRDWDRKNSLSSSVRMFISGLNPNRYQYFSRNVIATEWIVPIVAISTSSDFSTISFEYSLALAFLFSSAAASSVKVVIITFSPLTSSVSKMDASFSVRK